MRILAILLFALLVVCCRDKQVVESNILSNNERSVLSELSVFHDISSLPVYLQDVYSSQTSSYDTTWKNDDGFNGRYSFLKRNADSSLLIFNVKGSGVINRIWTPTPTEDTLDFYIDGDRPTFSVKFSDLFSGRQFPFVSPLCGNQLGGFYCYVPITFQRSCRIVFRGKKIQFHQIQYRLYPEGTSVKPFSLQLSQSEQEALQKINTLWTHKQKSIRDFYTGEILESENQVVLNPGEAKVIFQTKAPGRILGIELSPATAFKGTYKNVDLRITWDNEKSPAVFCPVADFFGFAFGNLSMQSLLLGTHDEKNYCFFPMPFDDAAKIELIRRSSSPNRDPVDVKVKVWYSSKARLQGQEGKFYTHWEVNKPEKGKHHIFLDLKGRGHYVGTVLQSQGLKAGMTLFFEGDDSTAIDGHFRMHGTGSEDYFNGGWYALLDRWDSKMSLPLHGSLDYSLPFARTGGYRLFLSDKISFQESFFHSIEHGPVGSAFPVEYTSTGMYYSDSPPAPATPPSNEPTQIFLPDTSIVYPQLIDYNIASELTVKTTWQYGTGGESYFFSGGNESWVRISLKDIPYGSYQLLFDLHKKADGHTFSVWQRQTQLSEWISTQQPAEERIKDLFICDLEINDFKNTVTIRFKQNAQESSLLLHRMILIKNQNTVQPD